MPLISIPKPLREKLGEEATASLVEMINQFGQENKDSIVDLAEKRFETKLVQEISGLREEMIRSDLAIKDELKEEIHKHSTATIKWMFLFWIGQIVVLLGILFAVFK